MENLQTRVIACTVSGEVDQRSITAMDLMRSSLTLCENGQCMKVSAFDGEHADVDVMSHVIDLRIREISRDYGRYTGVDVVTPAHGEIAGDRMMGSLTICGAYMIFCLHIEPLGRV